MFEPENDGVTEATPLDNAGASAFLDGLEISEAPEPTDLDDEPVTPDEPVPEEVPQVEPEGREYTVKVRGKEQTVRRTDAELIADIQKSLDYEHVKSELAAAKAGGDELNGYREIMSYLASRNGVTPAEMTAYYKGLISDEGQLAALKEEFPGTPDAALQAILEARKAQKADEEARAAADEEAAQMQELLDAVKAEYPNFDPSNLPDDVKTNIEAGMTPLEAMIRHERDELRREKADAQAKRAADEKNKQSRSRAVGGYKNVGTDTGRNAFIEGLFGGG